MSWEVIGSTYLWYRWYRLTISNCKAPQGPLSWVTCIFTGTPAFTESQAGDVPKHMPVGRTPDSNFATFRPLYCCRRLLGLHHTFVAPSTLQHRAVKSPHTSSYRFSRAVFLINSCFLGPTLRLTISAPFSRSCGPFLPSSPTSLSSPEAYRPTTACRFAVRVEYTNARVFACDITNFATKLRPPSSQLNVIDISI